MKCVRVCFFRNMDHLAKGDKGIGKQISMFSFPIVRLGGCKTPKECLLNKMPPF